MNELQEALNNDFEGFIKVYQVDYLVNGYARKLYFLGRHSAYEFRDSLKHSLPPKPMYLQVREFDEAIAKFLCRDFIKG